MSLETAMRSILFCLILLWSASAFAATATFKCTFSTFSDRKAVGQKAEDGLPMTFLVDSKAGKAYVIGNNGSNEVVLVQNQDGFTLVEITGTGNVMVTAITFGGQAVHSRHSMVSKSEIIPSQYYGRCTTQ